MGGGWRDWRRLMEPQTADTARQGPLWSKAAVVSNIGKEITIKVQSVINYIERNRAGLARLVVAEALRECGHPASVIETHEAYRIRSSVETALLIAANRPGLEEPPIVEEAQGPASLSDVAGSPAQAQETASEEPASEPEPEKEPAASAEIEMPGEEVLRERTPPRKRR